MKRIFILVVVTLLAVGSMFADQKTLIDFSLLTANVAVPVKEGEDPPQDAEGNPINNQNWQTLMDFTNEATGNFTARQKQAMKNSLAITNWNVVLSSSARTVTNKQLSYTKEATSKGAFGEEMQVMGVRIHFPAEAFNVSATIKPPFPIPAFNGSPASEDGTIGEPQPGGGIITPSRFEGYVDGENPFAEDDQEEPKPIGFGIIKNVGTIKSIAVDVYGLNFPHALYVLLIDDKNVETPYFMGYLNFEGWGELRWDNPAYIYDVRNRELRVDPIYPDSTPYVKFGGFVIQRQADAKGGDFISYFKDVKVIYDQAVLETERDIVDEGVWEIVKTRDTQRSQTELQRLGQSQMQRQLDLERQSPAAQTFGKRPDEGQAE